MTTNVRDKASQTLATDSRWTFTFTHNGEQKRVYVDDAPYHKLLKVDATGMSMSLVFMFAGDASVIDGWKESIRCARKGVVFTPFEQLPVDGMNVAVASSSASDLLYQFGHEISVEDQANFAGSGSYAAAESWRSDRCAVKAIESAKQTDAFTGGQVRFINLATGENNLVDDQVDLAELTNWFRSTVARQGELTMDAIQTVIAKTVRPANEKTMDVPDAVSTQTLLESFDQAVANGAAPKAPCDAQFRPWPANERARFVELMGNLFPTP